MDDAETSQNNTDAFIVVNTLKEADVDYANIEQEKLNTMIFVLIQ